MQSQPDALAIQFQEQSYSWGFVARIAAELQQLLETLSIASSERVGFVAHTRPTHVATLWGLLIANRCPSMIYGFQPTEKLAADIRSLRYPLVIADQSDWNEITIKAAKDAGSAGISLSTNGLSLVAGLETAGAQACREVVNDAAVETLSSGTTGTPKRILLSSQNLEASSIAAAQSIKQMSSGSAERVPLIVIFPLANISGVYSTVPACLSSHPIVLMEKFSVEEWLSIVKRYRPVTADVPPTALTMLINAGVTKEDLKSIKVIRSGAAPLDREVQRKFLEDFGIPINLSYGASEFCGVLTTWSMDELARYSESKLGSCGRPLQGVSLRIIDSDKDSELESNQIGLLEAKVDRMGPDWIRTSDLARIDEDGFMWFIGRADSTIFRGGFKISPEIVANALRQHPKIDDVAVIGEADARLGETPVAFVQAIDFHESLEDAELKEFARTVLAAYQVPTRFVLVDELPRTPSMKLDLRALKLMLSSTSI